jgi:hypothetical protein
MITSISILVGGVVSPDSNLVLDILIQIVELLHDVLLKRSAVLRDIHNVEISVFLHGLEEEGVNVGVVVEEVQVWDSGYPIEHTLILFRPQSAGVMTGYDSLTVWKKLILAIIGCCLMINN